MSKLANAQDKYWRIRKYVSVNGIKLELKTSTGSRWSYRFPPSSQWFGDYRDKFKAVLAASHHCGRSMAAMDWSPIERVRSIYELAEATTKER